MTSQMTRPSAELDLAIWQAEAESIDAADLYARLVSRGLPSEVAIRIRSMMDTTRLVAGKVIQIGKIIGLRLLEFVEKHTNLAVGVALAAACAFLASAVPFLGALLAPIVAALGLAVGVYAGHRLDKVQSNLPQNPNDGIVGLTQDVIEIARAFLQLFADVLRIIFDELSSKAE